MPIIQENPTYFSDKPSSTSSLNRGDVRRQQQLLQQQQRCGTFGARRKLSANSYEDTEDGSEMETFLSSCESNNSYSGSESNKTGINRNAKINRYNTTGSLRRNGGSIPSGNAVFPPHHPDQHQQSLKSASSSSSGISGFGRLGQLFRKSKSKLSVGSDSHASTVESSGLGSPTCTPDSSLSIYTNSLDEDSHSSSNSNQISPKHLEESMEDRFCSTYTFDDCGIFAANMYYNVGESSVFTIYHQHNNNGRIAKPSTSKSVGSTSPRTGGASDRDDEFEDCVQPYYNNRTFSTFPNPKRCSIASAASTTESTAPCGASAQVNENGTATCITGKRTTTAHPIQHDRDGYLRPNEPRNLRNVKNLYINESALENGNRSNGQVQQVQVDVHTPTSLKSGSTSFTEGFNSSAASANSNSGTRYQFDSAGSTTSQATTLVAGGSNNFLSALPEDETCNGNIGGRRSNFDDRRNTPNTSPLPVYMNRAYFGSNSINRGSQQRIAPVSSVAADCEPYCSLCASSIMGSPRQRSKMDVAIVKCKECFFSKEAESHLRIFFDKMMTEDRQKLDVSLKSYDLKDLDHPTDRVVVHSAKVQIVIISHHFLQRLKDEASRRPRLSPINRVFRSKNVIAVLMAVTAQEVLDGFEAVLPRFREWFSVDLRSTNKYDPEFCKKFTEQVIRIYNVELSNSSNFSVFPKKVTREQPKIAIIFKKPVEQQDEVRVELKTARQVNVVTDVKMENPHTTLLRVPESLSPDREAIVDVSVFINNCKIGGSRIKSELNLRRCEEDDIDRMTKVLPSFLDWLDRHISETLMRHYKECTDYTADPELELMNGVIICKGDILPTIMHFAAYYGLKKTAFIVLEDADGLTQCNVKNENGEIPSDIAFAREHQQIGQLIGEYQEISNSYRAYRYIKELLEKDTEEGEYGSMENGSELGNTGDAESCDTVSSNENDPKPSVVEPDVVLQSQVLPVEECSNSLESGYTEIEPTSKSEDEVKMPTPLTRRRDMRKIKGRQYVNLDGNPLDNPEFVEQRIKKISLASPETAKKRLTIVPPIANLNYDIPRTRAQDYEVPPPNTRPVQDRRNVLAPVFKTKHDGPHVTKSGYLIMNVDGISTTTEVESPKPCAIASTTDASQAEISDPETPQSSQMSAQQDAVNNNDSNKGAKGIRLNNTDKGIKNAVVLDPADEQLIELMNYFKDNTYDMHMVELLFENWKQRPDVQKSIEEKMKMVDKLREEYRFHNKGTKKLSAFDRFKTILSLKKKKSHHNISPPSAFDLYPVQERKLSESYNSTNGVSVVSPTSLTFSGPSLPPQPFNNQHSGPCSPPPLSSKSSISQECHDARSTSVSSHRTSIDSRFSDSSSDSEKSASEGGSRKNSQVQSPPPEYHSPMSKRFIPAYVSPSPISDSYQVPPPPRPVKPAKKQVPAIPEEPVTSYSPHEKSPDITSLPRKPVLPPVEESPTSPTLPQMPPSIPPKPNNNFHDTDPTSPPPQPPPRTQNTGNVFSYIDYKTKNQPPNPVNCPAVRPKAYQNLPKPVEDNEQEQTN